MYGPTRWSALQSHQLPRRTHIQIEILRLEAKLSRYLSDGFFQLHQGTPHVVHLPGRKGAPLHSSDRLPLEQSSDELHQREHQPRDRTLHVVRIGVPPERRPRAAAFELAAQLPELDDFSDSQTR